MLKQYKSLLILSLLLASLTFLGGCEEKGPAEKAGEQIDQAVEKTQEELGQVQEEIEDTVTDEGPAEKVGEQIDETAEEIKDEAKKAKEKLKSD